MAVVAVTTEAEVAMVWIDSHEEKRSNVFARYPIGMELDNYREEDKEEEEGRIISRMGYQLKDLAQSFTACLAETGPVAVGKLLHFTADMITSGGLILWQRLLWDYTYDHIGTASPRIFLYLFRKFKALSDHARKYTVDVFCSSKEVQELASEIALIVQGCPKKPKIKYPTVPPDTHDNDEWLRLALTTTDKAVVRRVWRRESDMEPMLHAGNQMVYSITEGATESALFWVKWLFEEDGIMRKKYGQGLTTAERGPAHFSASQRTTMGYYLVMILAETYKELAEKGMIRMNEEFQALLDIYRCIATAARRKMDTIALMIQLLVEVPKWKVPAAPALSHDPAQLQRIVSQSGSFYTEVLSHPLPRRLLPEKVVGLKKKKAKEPTKEEKLQRQLDLMDQAMMSYYKM